MLGTLVQGRVSLDGAAYGRIRLGPDNRDHLREPAPPVQRRLATPTRSCCSTTASTSAASPAAARRRTPRSFAHDELLAKFDAVFSGSTTPTPTAQDLETLAAALKPLSTWHALDTLQEAREACGGAGFLAENRLTGLRADLDIYVTFEGDNNVLLQLVGKRLLTDYGQEFKRARRAACSPATWPSTRQTSHRTARACAGSARPSPTSARGARAANCFKDEANQRELLTDRVNAMVAEIADALRGGLHQGPGQERGRCSTRTSTELIEAARAHAELLQWEAFTRALAETTDTGTKQVLTWLRDLFGLSLIEKHLAWYLINGRLSTQRARTVSGYIDRPAGPAAPARPGPRRRLRLRAGAPARPIAGGGEHERQDEAMEYYRRLRASADAPLDEKVLIAREKAAKKAAHHGARK